MPVLYGEGYQAFIRLQEEILRTTEDLSLLIWSTKSNDDIPNWGSALAYHPHVFRDLHFKVCNTHQTEEPSDYFWSGPSWMVRMSRDPDQQSCEPPSITSRGILATLEAFVPRKTSWGERILAWPFLHVDILVDEDLDNNWIQKAQETRMAMFGQYFVCLKLKESALSLRSQGSNSNAQSQLGIPVSRQDYDLYLLSIHEIKLFKKQSLYIRHRADQLNWRNILNELPHSRPIRFKSFLYTPNLPKDHSLMVVFGKSFNYTNGMLFKESKVEIPFKNPIEIRYLPSGSSLIHIGHFGLVIRHTQASCVDAKNIFCIHIWLSISDGRVCFTASRATGELSAEIKVGEISPIEAEKVCTNRVYLPLTCGLKILIAIRRTFEKVRLLPWEPFLYSFNAKMHIL